MTEGEAVTRDSVTPEQHFTQPPPRFSEASLVKRLEELGIGRPSTYASILQVLQDRKYVRLEKRRFIPGRPRAGLVTAFLTSFGRYVEYDLHRRPRRDQLDSVSAGEARRRRRCLREFRTAFHAAVGKASPSQRTTRRPRRARRRAGPAHLPPPTATAPYPTRLPQLARPAAWACEYRQQERLPSSAARNTAPKATSSAAIHVPSPTAARTRSKRACWASIRKRPDGHAAPRSLRALFAARRIQQKEKGRAVEAENGERAERRRPCNARPCDRIEAPMLPRLVGAHPEDADCRSKQTRSLRPLHQTQRRHLRQSRKLDDIFTIGLNHAVTLLAEKKANPKSRFTAKAPLKEPGEHPDTKAAVKVMNGKYGPYITDLRHQRERAERHRPAERDAGGGRRVCASAPKPAAAAKRKKKAPAKSRVKAAPSRKRARRTVK